MQKNKATDRPIKLSQNPRWLWMGLTFFILALAVWVWMQLSAPNSNSNYPREISVAEAAAKRNTGAFILDVRQPEEWNEYHIPGATLIPLGELAARVAELPSDQEIVVVCRSGNRSAQGRDILLMAGFKQVTSMAGGLLEWRATGYPTVSGP